MPIVLDAEQKVEAVASAVLKFIRGAESQVATKSPAAIAGLGVLLEAVDKAVSDVDQAAATPVGLLTIAFDPGVFADFKAVWPDIKALAEALGIKL